MTSFSSFHVSASNLSTLLLKLLKLFGTFFDLSISNSFTLDFKLAKSVFLAKDDVSAPIAFLKSECCRIRETLFNFHSSS